MQKLIKQNAEGLLKDIQEVGCFFRSALAMTEIKEKTTLTIGEINSAWVAACQKGYIVNRCIKQSAPIANLVALKGRWIEIGTFHDGKVDFYPSVAEKFRQIDALIQKRRMDTEIGTHFVVVDRRGKTVFDPYEPTLRFSGIAYSILYHYIRK